ncbi:MAG: hypothetical protein JO283_00945 [Bradyrhizobium sp.]|nr:hypothetical protein [Bradyrhizobium sp.]
MRRIIAFGLVGVSLGGCSSSSVSDYFKSTPPAVQVQLESQPAGADAKTSLGPGCKTPCSVSVSGPDNSFSVTFELAKYEPTTVPVKVVRNPGDLTTSATTTTDPNPVFAELQPAAPPPKAHAARPKRPKEPKVAAPAAAAAAPLSDTNAAPVPNTSSR